ncbi:MAG: hypothetical protein WDN06_16015 [Asticcacaulis sp.]
MSATSPAVNLDVTADDPNVHNIYNLTSVNVAPLPVSVAPDGPANFLTEVPAVAGAYYPAGVFDVNYAHVRHGNNPVQGMSPDPGSEYVFVYMKVRNGTGGDRTLNYDQIHVTLTDAASDRTYESSTPLGDDPQRCRRNLRTDRPGVVGRLGDLRYRSAAEHANRHDAHSRRRQSRAGLSQRPLTV